MGLLDIRAWVVCDYVIVVRGSVGVWWPTNDVLHPKLFTPLSLNSHSTPTPLYIQLYKTRVEWEWSVGEVTNSTPTLLLFYKVVEWKYSRRSLEVE